MGTSSGIQIFLHRKNYEYRGKHKASVVDCFNFQNFVRRLSTIGVRTDFTIAEDFLVVIYTQQKTLSPKKKVDKTDAGSRAISNGTACLPIL